MSQELPSDSAEGSLVGVISLPLRVPVSKKNDFILNLNHYRNAHFLVMNKAKVVFKQLVTPLLKDLPVMSRAFFVYTVYPKTRAASDVANYCSVVDKFFSDALVEAGKLPDDNFNFVPQVIYSFGSVDPENPRVEVHIYSLPESKPCKLSSSKQKSKQHCAITSTK